MEEEVPMDVTDRHWEIIEPMLPEPLSGPGKRGRPQRNKREVWDGILQKLRTGAPWKDIPQRYPPYQTCHRRFQAWRKDGTFERVLTALAMDHKERGASMSGKPSLTAPAQGPKKGFLRRENHAWQGQQDHGKCRPRWSCCRHLHRKCFAA